MLSSHQSACHPTDTELIPLLSDLIAAVEAGNIMLLGLLLDMSDGFDTGDHHILRERRDKTFGICQDPLKWISVYLSERTVSIMMSDAS